jgi:hypothetical protein
VADLLAEAREHQERAGAAIAGMSEACRPYDERTGEIRRGEQVRCELNEMLDSLEEIAADAALSDASDKAVAKARRTVDAMATSVENYHLMVTLNLEALRLPQDMAKAMTDNVLPALYLQRISNQTRDTESKRRMLQRAQAIMAPLQDIESSPLMCLSPTGRANLLEQGQTWVALYERSSSRVEGRNGQLELHHHGLHGLSETKLSALTAVRNFWSQREDGTTAAERFFEQKPRDLFEHLLNVMPNLPRPAQKRPRRAPPPLLN